jgi:site-specific recombinase
LLAAKMAERSAETGEHYITRTAGEYRQMLRQAAGGGVATAGTTLLKFAVMSAGLSAFWGGFWAGLLYAVSFVFIQLMHWTLATKQPAMTAPAMVAKLKDINSGPALDDFVDEVTHLVRSQVAAVLGNVGLVAPSVLLASWAWQAATLQPVLDTAQAGYVLQSLSLLNPGNLLFAAFTGVLLFASSLIAGWAENWFVLHRLDSALRYNPRITAVLGDSRAGRWADFMRRHVSGFAANISLGFMLGLIPPVLGFFGLGLEVRHVTLSMGQLAAAIASLGLQSLATAGVWWCLAAIPLIGVLNLLVSFWLAFHLALRARNLGGADRARIYAAILTRLRRQPRSFILPDKTVPAGPGHG